MIFVVHSDEINTELWVKSYLIPSIIVIDSQTLWFFLNFMLAEKMKEVHDFMRALLIHVNDR